MRKRIIALVLALSMVSGATLSAGAAGSISDLLPESVTLEAGAIEEGAQLIVQEADTSAYENETVAAAVAQFNDDTDDTVTTVKNVLDVLEEDVSDNATI
ncbi:MAG: hypothetical protein LIP11_00715 [Clostridiales bacterium]|nr:hypothetical protein [Clostridiales bacterium]